MAPKTRTLCAFEFDAHNFAAKSMGVMHFLGVKVRCWQKHEPLPLSVYNAHDFAANSVDAPEQARPTKNSSEEARTSQSMLVLKSMIFSWTWEYQSHTINTNWVDTLLRQLGKERVDGKGASRKGICTWNIPKSVLRSKNGLLRVFPKPKWL